MNNGIPYINIEDIKTISGRSVIVDQLPQASHDTLGSTYMVLSTSGTGGNIYNEYKTIFTDGEYSWEFIGSASSEDKMKLDATSNSVINAIINTYYRSTSSSDIVVNFPQVDTNTNFVEGFILYTEISSTKSLTMTPPPGTSIEYADGYDITEPGFYEINCLYNGVDWLITETKFNTQ